MSRWLAPVLVLGCLTAYADGPSDARLEEVEALRKRVQALEQQNRDILNALEALKGRLEAKPAPAPAPAGAPAPVPAPAPATQPLLPKEFLIGDTKLKMYGFLRVDAIADSSLMDRTIVPMYVRSEDPGAPAAVRARNDNSAFSIDPRLTRIGLDFDAGTPANLGYAKLTGKVETDFDTVNNGPSTESRQVPRFRLAYIRLAWPEDFTLTAGQQWDVISPLLPSVQSHSVLWNAGNLGDRRPQLTLAYEPRVGQGKWSFATSAGLAGAIDNNDTDTNNTIDGSQSGQPILQGRIGYARPLWVVGKDAALGLWSHQSEASTATAIYGMSRFHSESFGMDLMLPVTAKLTLKGEAWHGRNLPDVRGGITQGVDGWGRLIGSEGGWAELAYKFSDRWTLVSGYTVDNPANSDLLDQAGARSRNTVLYIGPKFYFGKFEVGVEYLRWETDYKDLKDGTNNRFNLYTQMTF